VRRTLCGYQVDTDHGSWLASNVVIATGDCDKPLIPAIASGISGDIRQVAPSWYKKPSQLPDGGVLVVGASATGIQLAAEIHGSGRPVTVAVGRHTRLPRTYRGKDILWWLETMGVLGERAEDVKDLEVSRNQPSLQLIGSPDRRTLDLGSLAAAGVRLVGRATGASGHRMTFGDDLVETIVAADAKLAKLRSRIDHFIEAMAIGHELEAAEPFALTEVPDTPEQLDLRAEGIRTVLWATGYRRDYSWLHLPLFDSRGEIMHRGGVTPLPGVYVMGLRFLRRRNSSFIDGQALDAAELSEHLAARRSAARASYETHAA
jgi:putative flavoprotein involved in K+ transport